MSNKGDCIILNKCIFGLIQVARQYYKKAVKVLKKSRFIEGNVNPCLYLKKNEKGVVSVALYVDDNLMIGYIEITDKVITTLKECGLVLDVMEGLQDYLSFEVKFSKDKKRAWLGQPHLIKNLMLKLFETIKCQVCLNFQLLGL